MKLKYIIFASVLSLFSCKEAQKNTTDFNKKEESISVNKTTASDTLEKKEPENSIGTDALKKDAVDHYICYKDDKKAERVIWISFTEKSRAIQVKYKGQNTAIDLVFVKEEFIKGGAHPTIITYYNEIHDGKLNGEYKLTHSGNWDYVKYIRGKDGKKFNFTIDHNSNSYRKSSCF
ncbi:hypothetical protein A8C32_04165 [Flavivirga aquatica]|uniref:Lipoprotein n=1 Tax=Flavivirga aquatica TaxID=1849968 RepID=A0A1E5TBB7_9FLAO|nr:hypothetical protein [Flavivirga aquatica]OEK08651.1 hypothetical protein A8C32_04165 [Flavivirga aquatica]